MLSDEDWLVQGLTAPVERGSTDEPVMTLPNTVLPSSPQTEQLSSSQAEHSVSSSENSGEDKEHSTVILPDAVPNSVSSEPSENVVEIETLGRGHRNRAPPAKFQDYVSHNVHCIKYTEETHLVPICSPSSSSKTIQGKILYPFSNYVTNLKFSESHQAYLAAITAASEPKTYYEAIKHKIPCDSMKDEIVAQEESGTWDIASRPPGKKAIPCMWIYRNKYNIDGTIRRHKSRLVACGNSQKEGDDFKETFAPVVKMNTVCFLLRLATIKGWEVHQMDVYNAFLHGDLEEEVYMRLPPWFTHSDPSKFCRLNKSIYGLRQAPRCWFSKLSSALIKFGFVQSYYDYSLFSYTKGDKEV